MSVPYTFWEGRREADVKRVEEYCTDMQDERWAVTERAKTRAVKDWGPFSLRYYRHYNDGCAFFGKLGHMFSRWSVERAGSLSEHPTSESGLFFDGLERLGDAIIDQLLKEAEGFETTADAERKYKATIYTGMVNEAERKKAEQPTYVIEWQADCDTIHTETLRGHTRASARKQAKIKSQMASSWCFAYQSFGPDLEDEETIGSFFKGAEKTPFAPEGETA